MRVAIGNLINSIRREKDKAERLIYSLDNFLSKIENVKFAANKVENENDFYRLSYPSLSRVCKYIMSSGVGFPPFNATARVEAESLEAECGLPTPVESPFILVKGNPGEMLLITEKEEVKGKVKDFWHLYSGNRKSIVEEGKKTRYKWIFSHGGFLIESYRKTKDKPDGILEYLAYFFPEGTPFGDNMLIPFERGMNFLVTKLPSGSAASAFGGREIYFATSEGCTSRTCTPSKTDVREQKQTSNQPASTIQTQKQTTDQSTPPEGSLPKESSIHVFKKPNIKKISSYNEFPFRFYYTPDSIYLASYVFAKLANNTIDYYKVIKPTYEYFKKSVKGLGDKISQKGYFDSISSLDSIDKAVKDIETLAKKSDKGEEIINEIKNIKSSSELNYKVASSFKNLGYLIKESAVSSYKHRNIGKLLYEFGSDLEKYMDNLSKIKHSSIDEDNYIDTFISDYVRFVPDDEYVKSLMSSLSFAGMDFIYLPAEVLFASLDIHKPLNLNFEKVGAFVLSPITYDKKGEVFFSSYWYTYKDILDLSRGLRYASYTETTLPPESLIEIGKNRKEVYIEALRKIEKKLASLKRYLHKVGGIERVTRALVKRPLKKGSVKYSIFERLPKGWTEESVMKYWSTLSKDDPEDPIRGCTLKMFGRVINPVKFCINLRDRVEGPGWRSSYLKNLPLPEEIVEKGYKRELTNILSKEQKRKQVPSTPVSKQVTFSPTSGGKNVSFNVREAPRASIRKKAQDETQPTPSTVTNPNQPPTPPTTDTNAQTPIPEEVKKRLNEGMKDIPKENKVSAKERCKEILQNSGITDLDSFCEGFISGNYSQ